MKSLFQIELLVRDRPLPQHPATKNYDLSSVKAIMVGAAPTSAELTGQLMALLPNIQCASSSRLLLPPLFLTCQMASLPRVWSHRDCYDRVHGTDWQEGWNFGVCRTAYTRCSGEVAQA